MVGTPRHQSIIRASRSYVKTKIDEADDLPSTRLARKMLEEGRMLVWRRENGAEFTLDVPNGYGHITGDDLMFSLMILAFGYGLRAESFEHRTFTFRKIDGIVNEEDGSPQSSTQTIFPLELSVSA